MNSKANPKSHYIDYIRQYTASNSDKLCNSTDSKNIGNVDLNAEYYN